MSLILKLQPAHSAYLPILPSSPTPFHRRARVKPELGVRRHGKLRLDRCQLLQALPRTVAALVRQAQVETGVTGLGRRQRRVERAEGFAEQRNQTHEPLVRTRLDQRAEQQQVHPALVFRMPQRLAQALGIA